MTPKHSRRQHNPPSSKALQPSQSSVPPPSRAYQHPTPRTEQERRQFAAADRRESALLWTEDRPFSIFKS